MLKSFVLCLLVCSSLTANLPSTDLKCGTGVLTVEIAASPSNRAQGLMYRKTLQPDHGMLFIFERPQQLSFWMRNTYVALSIAYIDTHGTIREIYDLEPLDESPKTSLCKELLYAIESPRGWWQAHQCAVGTTIEALQPEQVQHLLPRPAH